MKLQSSISYEFLIGYRFVFISVQYKPTHCHVNVFAKYLKIQIKTLQTAKTDVAVASFTQGAAIGKHLQF